MKSVGLETGNSGYTWSKGSLKPVILITMTFYPSLKILSGRLALIYRPIMQWVSGFM